VDTGHEPPVRSSRQKNGQATKNSPEHQPGWRSRLPVHPAADLFPLLSSDELRELADDIDKNDLQEPVTLYRDPDLGDCLLDGRNRLDALELLGDEIFDYPGKRKVFYRGKRILNCDFRRMDAPSFDPYAYVISKNIKRRHLTAEQKRDLIGKLLKAKPEASNVQIAKLAKADDKTVASVRADLESTSEIPRLAKTVGRDGKARPARLTPKPKKPSSIDIGALASAWREVELAAQAGNQTNLKASVTALLAAVTRVLGAMP
jgi:hypothetical protein